MDWLDEWWSAMLGPEGFWHREDPSEHFHTAVGDSADPHLAAQFARTLMWVARKAGPPIHRNRGPLVGAADRPAPLVGMVDLGAADGALLRAVAAEQPDWSLLGVDVRPAPELPAAATWAQALWDVRASCWTTAAGRPAPAAPWAEHARSGPLLVVAHEWLDELPCRVARRHGHDDWELLGPDGPTGATPDAEESAWLHTWAGDAEIVEIGLTRDRAWAAIARDLPAGSLLMAVDYGHVRETRPSQGSLVGYRHGRLVPPVPDGHTNITAPVAIDALAAAVEHVPGTVVRLRAQQAQVVTDSAPELGPEEGATPLAALMAANRRRVLADPARFGANWWLVHHVGGTP